MYAFLFPVFVVYVAFLSGWICRCVFQHFFVWVAVSWRHDTAFTAYRNEGIALTDNGHTNNTDEYYIKKTLINQQLHY
jgi:hypothetical protein